MHADLRFRYVIEAREVAIGFLGVMDNSHIFP